MHNNVICKQMQAIVFYKSQLASHILTFAVCHISNKALEPVGVNFEIPRRPAAELC